MERHDGFLDRTPLAFPCRPAHQRLRNLPVVCLFMNTSGRFTDRADSREPFQSRQAIETSSDTMKSTCPFLETRHPEGLMCCTAGVNFTSVGAERELCRKCPLANLDNLPLCPNAEIYAFLRNSPTGESVELEFACLADAIPTEERCQGCPDRFPSAG